MIYRFVLQYNLNDYFCKTLCSNQYRDGNFMELQYAMDMAIIQLQTGQRNSSYLIPVKTHVSKKVTYTTITTVQHDEQVKL